MQSHNNLSTVNISSMDVELTKIRLRRKKVRINCLDAIDTYEQSKGLRLEDHRKINITHLREFLAESNEKYKTADLIALYIKTYTTNYRSFHTGFLGRSELRNKLFNVIDRFCPILKSSESNLNLCTHYYEMADALEALIGTVEPLLDEAKKFRELLAEAAKSVERTQDALDNLNSIVENDINASSNEVRVDKSILLKINTAIHDLNLNLAIEKKNVEYYKEQCKKAELKIELLNKSIALKNTLIENLRAEIALKETELKNRNHNSNQSPGLGPVSSHSLFQPSIQLSNSFVEEHKSSVEEKELAFEHKRPSSVPPGIRSAY